MSERSEVPMQNEQFGQNDQIGQNTVRIGAVELAERIGILPPTEQQRVVIESPMHPALVVAGAGSGKTETMAARVIWLVANGLVAPQDVLGLTFTRKAAGSLAERIGRRLGALREHGLVPVGAGDDAVEQAAHDAFAEPTVATYNAFASGLSREHALAIGREPDAEVIGDAAAWQLARRVVVDHGDRRLVSLDLSVDRVSALVLELSRELADHVADLDAVRATAERFVGIADLPYTSGKAKATPYASVVAAVAAVGALDPLLDLVEFYRIAKRRRGVVEFSDQVAFALEVCDRSPSAVALTRDRHRVVLLDEYQDTSVVQSRLLSALFRGLPVMAVGDPNQSIYGWRGASAANLARFGRDFAADDLSVGLSVGQPSASVPVVAAPVFSLSTSWRNATGILDAANEIAAPLRAISAVPVDALQARPTAPAGAIDVQFVEDLVAEAAVVAQWCATELAKPSGRFGPDGIEEPRDAAILFRNRRHMSRFAEALGELGVPHHIVGLGGLLETPEIVDLVCALRVLVDPDAGSDLVRLLAGPRWRIGVRDLAHLERVAAWLHDRDWAHRLLDDDVRARRRASAAADDGRSIVDALDFVVDARAGHTMLETFSEIGLLRLRDAGERLRRLRMRLGLPLPELVRLVEQELRLDLETVANERLGVGGGNLRAFRDELESFMRIDDRATVASLLSWIDRARDAESLAPASIDPEPGAVQLLTVHASKGLEWDAVAIPRLVVDEFPGRSRAGSGWVRVGAMPAEFRGDADELPTFGWADATNQAEVDQALKRYRTELAERHAEEERRLAYVAITRAKDDLLLAGSFWGGQREFRQPSSVLVELADAELIPALPEAPDGDAPTAESDETMPWPGDPLGSRRARVQHAADAVLAAGADEAASLAVAISAAPWAGDLDLLLAERAAAGVVAPQPLPERIAASGFKDWIEDADRVRARIRRPMPERPFRATRVGTRFHSWVEARYGTAPAADLVDAADDELDVLMDAGLDSATDAAALDGDADAQLAILQAAFERSEWAGLAPEAIEIELHLPFAGRTVICRIDAVFKRGDRWQVVDWKTGRAPRDAAELRRRELQLALYRLAWADHAGVAPDDVDVAFFFVADERVIVPERVLSEAELLRQWTAAVGEG